jgi:NADPH:quinone reductase-like Zn-dependent oxidoreductase
MKKVVIHKPGGYRQLTIEECPDPEPAGDEVLIDVHAAGVNFADCVTRMGLYASARHYEGYPLTPGFEAAGTVRKTGAQISDLEPGTVVMAVSRFSAQATKLVVPRRQVFRVPAMLTLAQAAGLPAAALTAWFALFELAHVRSGDSLLVHSAAGGVGSMLVQMGKLAGCKVTGVVGATHKVETVCALGADSVIDKSRQDLWTEAERVAANGFDVVLDANGVTTLRESYRHLAPVGRLVVYGFHGMLQTRQGVPNRLRLAMDYLRTPRFSPFDLTTQNRSVLGFNLSYLFDRRDTLQRGMDAIIGWVESGKLKLPALTTYPLELVADAHRDLESGRTTGKLVLLTSDTTR